MKLSKLISHSTKRFCHLSSSLRGGVRARRSPTHYLHAYQTHIKVTSFRFLVVILPPFPDILWTSMKEKKNVKKMLTSVSRCSRNVYKIMNYNTFSQLCMAIIWKMIATFLHPVTRRQFFYYTNLKSLFLSLFLYFFTLWHSSCIVCMCMDESGVIFELLLYLHLPQSWNGEPHHHHPSPPRKKYNRSDKWIIHTYRPNVTNLCFVFHHLIYYDLFFSLDYSRFGWREKLFFFRRLFHFPLKEAQVPL